MDYQKEQIEWDELVKQVLGDDAELKNVSVYSSDCRIYFSSNSVYKIRRLTPASIRGRLNSLEDEFLILKSLKSTSSVPKPIDYERRGSWEILRMTKIPSLTIFDPTFGQPKESIRDYLQILKFAWFLNMAGCSHGDFTLMNAGRNIEGSISVFDFDQALLGNPLRCWLRDFLGISINMQAMGISLLGRSCSVKMIWPFVKRLSFLKRFIISMYQRLTGISIPAETLLKRRASLLDDDDLNILVEAWDIALISNASSPGRCLAYYSLDISGINFPGERPWLLRWNMIRNNIDFRGKKFLELGCNIGLLTTHAKLVGATACLGLDIDEDIVRAAILVSQAFHVEVNFLQLNLDDLVQWEDDLSGYDIVSALSVMYWINDKERVWSFLSKHKEVIYEGHEPDDQAEENLRKRGFIKIKNLGRSERGRKVFHAVKPL